MDERRLIKCPFCDIPDLKVYDDITAVDGSEGFAVGCTGCCCFGPVRDRIEDAICAWNKRSERFQAAEIERLQKANEEIREESGCPPDGDLLSWIKLLNRMYEADCNKEGSRRPVCGSPGPHILRENIMVTTILPASSELDALVAEKVMGWKYDNCGPKQVPHWHKPDGTAIRHRDWNPDTRIADAWEVLEKMTATGWGVELIDSSGQGDGWIVGFFKSGKLYEGGGFVFNESIGENVECDCTVQLAICRATLEAVEGNKPDVQI